MISTNDQSFQDILICISFTLSGALSVSVISRMRSTSLRGADSTVNMIIELCMLLFVLDVVSRSHVFDNELILFKRKT